MKSTEFVALSASTMALTALGIDLMLPAFGELREHFELGAQSTSASKVITFFFMGQIAQIFFGPLSDYLGRTAVLKIGFPLYIIGGIAACVAPSLEIMLASRFLAGMGASAVLVATVASIRDRYVGNEMARIMSLILTIFLFTPVIAPFLGVAILSFSSWEIVFLTPPLFAIIVFLWSLRLEDSHPIDKRTPLKWKVITRSIRQVLGNRTFLRYTLITTLLFTSLSTYVASSEYIIGEIYGRPELFSWIFGGIGLVMSGGTLLNSTLSTRFGSATTIKWLLILYFLISACILLFTLWSGDPPNMVIFFVACALLLSINLAIEPNSSALAMTPMGDVAGMASSVYGTTFFFIGGFLGSVISDLLKTGVLPLVASFFVMGLFCVLLVFMGSTRGKDE